MSRVCKSSIGTDTTSFIPLDNYNGSKVQDGGVVVQLTIKVWQVRSKDWRSHESEKNSNLRFSCAIFAVRKKKKKEKLVQLKEYKEQLYERRLVYPGATMVDYSKWKNIEVRMCRSFSGSSALEYSRLGIESRRLCTTFCAGSYFITLLLKRQLLYDSEI